jgi:hypothetical protein
LSSDSDHFIDSEIHDTALPSRPEADCLHQSGTEVLPRVGQGR